MMKLMTRTARWLAVPALVSVMAVDGVAQTSVSPLEYSAQLVNLNTRINLPNQTPVTLTVSRWSTPGEREQLLTALKQGGRDGLLKMMQTVPRVGAIRIPGSLNYDFHFALRTEDLGGNVSILLIADRPVGYAEAAEGPRTLDYRFMVVQMQLNAIGRGKGQISMVTKIEADSVTGDINLETWEDLYVTLRDIRRTSGR